MLGKSPDLGYGAHRVRREAEAAAEGADLRTNIAGAEGDGDEAAGAPEPYSVLPSAEEAEAGGGLPCCTVQTQHAWPHSHNHRDLVEASRVGQLPWTATVVAVTHYSWSPSGSVNVGVQEACCG